MMLHVLSHSQVICDQYYTSNLHCQLNCQLQKEAGFSCSPANKETQPLYIIIIKIYFYKRTAQWFIYNRIYWIFTNNNWNLFIFVVISKSNKKLSIYFHAFRFDWRKLPFARLSFSPPAQNQTSCSSEFWPRWYSWVPRDLAGKTYARWGGGPSAHQNESSYSKTTTIGAPPDQMHFNNGGCFKTSLFHPN